MHGSASDLYNSVISQTYRTTLSRELNRTRPLFLGSVSEQSWKCAITAVSVRTRHHVGRRALRAKFQSVAGFATDGKGGHFFLALLFVSAVEIPLLPNVILIYRNYCFSFFFVFYCYGSLLPFHVGNTGDGELSAVGAFTRLRIRRWKSNV